MNAVIRAPIEGEILAPADVVHVTAATHPLKAEHHHFEVAAGASIAEIVAEAASRYGVSRLARSAHVTIDGHVVAKANWHRIRVKAGVDVTVRALPGKAVGNILRSVLSLALVVAASFIVGPEVLGISSLLGGGALGTIAASAVAGSIILAGNLLLNRLFPSSSTTSSDGATSYSISAQQNGASKWGPIPVQLGKTRNYPKYAASPYTEFDGDDQYLRMLVVWGYGPIKIEDIRLGTTAIDLYDDVEIQTFEGYPTDGQQTLYPSQVVETDLSINLTQEFGPFVQSSAEDAAEIVIDLVAPQGVVDIDTQNGKRGSYSVSFQIDMRPTGSSDAWTPKETVTITGSSNDPLRRSYRYVMGGGQWDVQITRLTADDTDDDGGKYSTVDWTAIKTFRTAPAIDFPKPLAITALRIRATSQLNGTIDNLNALCTTVCSAFNGTDWVANQETQSPADLFRLVLQGPANARAQPDTRLDLATIEEWWQVCKDKGFRFNMYRDFAGSVRDTLKDICAAARAVPLFRDGLWSVAWEEDTAPIVQHFTPRNSWDFTWSQTYKVFPHGLRCKFVNETKDYVEDEMLVFDDGYDKTNATLYEQAEFPGVTDPDLIYKNARYRIADAKQRPATYKMTVDFEYLIAQRGDRVVAAYDVIETGIASGRVQAIDGQTITLDEPTVMEAGTDYSIRFRLANGSSVVRSVTNNPGRQTEIDISGDVPEVGDLYTFGITGQETGIYRVLEIKPGENLSADVTLVDDGQTVQASDGDTDIPGGTTSGQTDLSRYTPRNVRAVQSIEDRSTGTVHIVRIFWDAVFGPDYASFECIASSDTGQTIRVDVDASTQVAEFDNLPDGSWSFRVRAFLKDGRYTPSSQPLLIGVDVDPTTVGVGMDQLRGDAKQFLTEVKSAAQFAASGAKAQQAAYIATVDQLINSAGDAQSEYDKIRQGISADLGKASASFQQMVDVVATQTEALATELTTLSASVDNFSAEVATEATARATADNAFAEQLTTVNATLGNLSAGGLIKLTGTRNPSDGVYSKVDIAAYVSAGNNLASAAMSLRVVDNGNGGYMSENLFIADNTLFTDGVHYAQAIRFDGNGNAYLAVAHIGTVYGGYLKSEDQTTTVFDIADGTLTISDNT